MTFTRILPTVLLTLFLCTSVQALAYASPQQQDNQAQASERWKKMTPEQRAKVRKAQAKYRKMTPEQKRKMRQKYKKQKKKQQ